MNRSSRHPHLIHILQNSAQFYPIGDHGTWSTLNPMPQPRYRQISVEDTPYYHCISRCVRRAFLCGKDSHTGFDFEHRRQWIVDRIKLLCSVFAIDLCAFAIMSNLDNADLSEHELEYVSELFTTWRNRLCDLSWLMRCLNEPIARMANAEDHCTGRFWEGRFKSQALLDARAVLACMAYVDLNPIRAAMAKTPEQSDYTSIQERILQPANSCLRPFTKPGAENTGIPFELKDYLELVDWGGREIKRNKRGSMPAHAPPILTRLKMDAAPVLSYLGKADQVMFGALGPVSMLRSFARSVGRSFIKGQSIAKQLCPERT